MDKKKKFLIFGVVLVVIQILAFIGGLVAENKPTISVLLIILTIIDFYYYLKKDN